jgi:hypothetical protein
MQQLTYNLVFVLVQTFDLSMNLSVVSATAE